MASVGMTSPPRRMFKVPPTKKDDRKLFVGGLPANITEEEFRTFFAQFGELVDAVVMFDRETRRSRGFGFVTFRDPAVCAKLLNSGDGDGKVGRLEMQGKMCEIKAATPKEPTSRGNRDMYMSSQNGAGGGDRNPLVGSTTSIGSSGEDTGMMYPSYDAPQMIPPPGGGPQGALVPPSPNFPGGPGMLYPPHAVYPQPMYYPPPPPMYSVQNPPYAGGPFPPPMPTGEGIPHAVAPMDAAVGQAPPVGMMYQGFPPPVVVPVAVPPPLVSVMQPAPPGNLPSTEENGDDEESKSPEG